jgi:hypothetical protein
VATDLEKALDQINDGHVIELPQPRQRAGFSSTKFFLWHSIEER